MRWTGSASGYVTDAKGQKVAAIVDLDEIKRIGQLIEDLYDLRMIAQRQEQPVLDYEEYSAQRTARMHVQAGV